VPNGAVPFDMFHGDGFGHRGDDCTFETLQKDFRVRDARVKVIAEIINDADISDEKFGREESFGIDQVLKGWAHQGIPDANLTKNGISNVADRKGQAARTGLTISSGKPKWALLQVSSYHRRAKCRAGRLVGDALRWLISVGPGGPAAQQDTQYSEKSTFELITALRVWDS
jgi:hypothetical protein